MPLAAGTRLGVFEILSPIGKGGMGEVYRAKDTKLDREVAVKILPEEMAKRPEWMARFEREAKLLAALDHPHIAAIHGLHEEDGQHFLIMELVDGETLADRLKRGAIAVHDLPKDRPSRNARSLARRTGQSCWFLHASESCVPMLSSHEDTVSPSSRSPGAVG